MTFELLCYVNILNKAAKTSGCCVLQAKNTDSLYGLQCGREVHTSVRVGSTAKSTSHCGGNQSNGSYSEINVKCFTRATWWSWLPTRAVLGGSWGLELPCCQRVTWARRRTRRSGSRWISWIPGGSTWEWLAWRDRAGTSVPQGTCFLFLWFFRTELVLYKTQWILHNKADM